MNKTRIKPVILAGMFCVGTAFSLSSCDTGTSPGETNVERSDIKEEGSMVVPDEDRAKAEQDSLERYYDHADSAGGAVHAGDGQRQTTEEGQKRDNGN